MRRSKNKLIRTLVITLSEKDFGKENVATVLLISDCLVPLSNEVLLDIEQASERIKPLRLPIDERRNQARSRAHEAGFGALWEPKNKDVEEKEWYEMGVPEDFIQERKQIFRDYGKLYAEHGVTVFDHNTNYAQLRLQGHEPYAKVSAGFRRGCIKMRHAEIFSFLVLRSGGDKDARPPGKQEARKFFYTLRCEPGCSIKGGSKLRIGLGDLGKYLILAMPGLDNPDNKPLRQLLRKDAKIKSFTLSRRSARNPDRPEADLRKEGVWRISVNYELPLPNRKPVTKDNTISLALGSQWLGVACAKGEFFWRAPAPHKKWLPIINAIESRCEGLRKGSKSWKAKMFGNQPKRSGGRQKCFTLMARQQKQTEYETIAQKLLQYGVHFRVTKLNIRSKPGALADASNPERRGPLQANREVSSTGVTSLVRKLKEKVKEYGGTVKEIEPPHLPRRFRDLAPGPKKVIIARLMAQKSNKKTAVAVP